MPSLILPFSNSRFIHVPKTGGSWVAGALDILGCNYQLLDPDKKTRGGHAGYYYGDYTGFSFGFVRNPFDWYKSFFKFNRGLVNRTNGDLGIRRWDVGDINEFVFDCIENGHNLSNQLKYFFGNFYEIGFIGRYENLCEDLIKGLHLAGEFFDEGDDEKIRNFYGTVINDSENIACGEYSTEAKNFIFRTDRNIFRRFDY